MVIAPGLHCGRLTVVAPVPNDRRRRWECRCACGQTRLVRTVNLHKGQQSCGCLRGHRRLPRGLTPVRVVERWRPCDDCGQGWCFRMEASAHRTGGGCWLCDPCLTARVQAVLCERRSAA